VVLDYLMEIYELDKDIKIYDVLETFSIIGRRLNHEQIKLGSQHKKLYQGKVSQLAS